MPSLQHVFLAALAGVATAKPLPVVDTVYTKAEPKVSFMEGRQANAEAAAPDPRQMIAWPAPNVDKNNLDNLKATNDATLYFAENAEEVPQQVATIDSQDPENPMVQLEFTNFVEKQSCTDNSASITFSKKEAFDVAAADWPTHEQFVIVSTDPACGEEHDATKRDYMMAKSIKADAASMTITADVEFVEWKQAFGESAKIHGVIGEYTPKNPVSRRQIDGSTNFDWDVFPTTPLPVGFAGETGFGLFGDVNFDVACIGCGTKGAVTVTGTFDFSLFDGVEEASITVDGSVTASLNLGLIARATQNFTVDRQLANIPLSPLSLAGIVTVGPLITVDASAGLDLTATGEMILGATLEWPNLSVTGDFAEGTAESSGLDPNVTPRSDFEASLSANLRINAPISIGVGINIANGLFDRSLALQAAPGMNIRATIDTDPACAGVAVNAGMGVPVNLDVFAVTTVPITSIGTTLFETCFEVPIPTDILPNPGDLLGIPSGEESAAPAPTDAQAPPAEGDPNAQAPAPEADPNAAPPPPEASPAAPAPEGEAAPAPEVTPAPAEPAPAKF